MSPTMNCCSNKTYNIHNTDDRLFALMHHSIGYSSQHNPVIVDYKRRKIVEWEKDILDGNKRWIVDPKAKKVEEEDEYQKYEKELKQKEKVKIISIYMFLF